MSELLFANQAATTLAAPITGLATSVTLNNATSFPNPSSGQSFLMTFNDVATGLLVEIVLCTARSGNVCTIVRGQEGTTAQSWSANDLCTQKVTAGTMANMAQPNDLQSQLGNYAVDAGSVNAISVVTSPVQPMSALIGSPFRVLVKYTNTGPATFRKDSGTPISIISPGGTAATLQPGALQGGFITTFVYDGTYIEIQSGGSVALGTAAYKTASDNSQTDVASISGVIVSGHVAVFADVNGTIEDGGALGTSAYAAKSSNVSNIVACVSEPTAIGNMATFSDLNGTIGNGGPPTPSATTAQMESPTSSTVYANPATLYAHPAIPKAWVIFAGQSTNGSCTITASYLVSSVTRTGNGAYTVQTNGPTMSSGYAVPTADNVNDLYGKGSSNSGSNPAFTIQYSNRGAGGSLDPGYGFVAIYGRVTN